MKDPNEEKVPASIERSLRKGNINFDFLQPEEIQKEQLETSDLNRRTSQRQGKRGLFNRGRPPRPFKKIHLLLWVLLLMGLAAAIGGIAISKHFLFLLLLPIVLTLFLGTLIMVTLLLVKPL
ncbi:hypothetical protein LPTSP4_32440 [Leptospira ryugenii]|uniref:Uncharacterized protein n=1 Tax=Leptospira ryugenii TaxID=1917863 RepID=A0A2P2E4C6_9LEPT|nr:hypothetical protein [Leptospira ryugenii]GBF51706.1 hypothetical protein LPTSP4_32440 [Leptospira ryugenii]